MITIIFKTLFTSQSIKVEGKMYVEILNKNIPIVYTKNILYICQAFYIASHKLLYNYFIQT